MKILNTNRREYLLLAILLTLCIAGRTQTVEQVRDEIQRQGIEHPEIVLAYRYLKRAGTSPTDAPTEKTYSDSIGKVNLRRGIRGKSR